MNLKNVSWREVVEWGREYLSAMRDALGEFVRGFVVGRTRDASSLKDVVSPLNADEEQLLKDLQAAAEEQAAREAMERIQLEEAAKASAASAGSESK